MSKEKPPKPVEFLNEKGSEHAPGIYATIIKEGHFEMSRPLWSLIWSGIAAGISMVASVLGKSFILHKLGNVPWAAFVADFGYSFGFIIVVLGQMQLFTENTITTVLPLLNKPRWNTLKATARIWGVVFLANLVGAFFVAFLTVELTLGTKESLESILSVAEHAVMYDFVTVFKKGIPAGFYVAALVWVTRAYPQHSLGIIILLTYLIAAGDFSHCIAGAIEAFMVCLHHADVSWWVAVEYISGAVLGNIVGGTALFALLAYGQVFSEIKSKK